MLAKPLIKAFNGDGNEFLRQAASFYTYIFISEILNKVFPTVQRTDTRLYGTCSNQQLHNLAPLCLPTFCYKYCISFWSTYNHLWTTATSNRNYAEWMVFALSFPKPFSEETESCTATFCPRYTTAPAIFTSSRVRPGRAVQHGYPGRGPNTICHIVKHH